MHTNNWEATLGTQETGEARRVREKYNYAAVDEPMQMVELPTPGARPPSPLHPQAAAHAPNSPSRSLTWTHARGLA
jgi:hypothetical protein